MAPCPKRAEHRLIATRQRMVKGWLWPEQQQLLYRFRNDLAAQHAKW